MQPSLFSCHETRLNLAGADIRYRNAFVPDHQQYFDHLKNEIHWQRDTVRIAGKTVPVPRLQAWYGDAGANYSYSGIALQPLAWTATLLRLKTLIEDAVNQSFNSVLINYYRDGNDSVAWHSDDEPELGSAPVIASLSLGATRRFSLRGPLPAYRSENADSPATKTLHIDLEGGSLLIMAGQTQRYWRHQVAKTRVATGARINLTFRRIMSPAVMTGYSDKYQDRIYHRAKYCKADDDE